MSTIKDLIVENQRRYGAVPGASEVWQTTLGPGAFAVFHVPTEDDAPTAMAFLAVGEAPSEMPEDYVYGRAHGRGYFDDAPVAMPRAMLLYPLSGRQFAAARAAGFPTDVGAVNALVGFQTGGSA